MMVKKIQCELISINNPIKDIYTLEFVPFKGNFRFRAGQFLHIAIDENYDGIGQWPDSRCFSIQSSQGEETVRITYAVKGAFTKQMEQQLKIGSIVWLKLPYGDLLTQTHCKINTVFIAGGTGITPFLSLFTHKSFKEYTKPRIYLGFRSKEHNIYGRELDFAKYNTDSIEHNDIIIFYQDKDGIIDIEHILLKNGLVPNYFISGPPGMIHIFRKTLIEKGIPVRNIFTDDWE